MSLCSEHEMIHVLVPVFLGEMRRSKSSGCGSEKHRNGKTNKIFHTKIPAPTHYPLRTFLQNKSQVHKKLEQSLADVRDHPKVETVPKGSKGQLEGIVDDSRQP